MMKILLLTQYFPPETGAPQNRLFDLALKLRSFGAEVKILTAFPNYPQYRIPEEYRGKIYAKEFLEGLEVHRSWIYVSPQKSIFKRLLNYFSFTFSSFWTACFKVGQVDLIICESPPLFLGFTAVLLKYIKGARLVFNVSDLWPESAIKLGIVTNRFLISLSTWLELWIYKHSNKISGQTQGIIADIQKRMPEKPLFWLRNGVDAVDIDRRIGSGNWRIGKGFSASDFLVYFGGLLGYAQGLEVILEAAKRTAHIPGIKYVFVGDGPEKEKLLQIKHALQLDNVFFFPGVSRLEIIDVIRSIDAAVIPLRKVDLFLGAIPSKIFEILYLQKPILLGIEGEAKDLFIDQANAGLFFEPENGDALAECVKQLYTESSLRNVFGVNGRDFVLQHFNRQQIALDFWEFVNSSNRSSLST